tara:strand:- start:1551 stop:1772 length:222 start_codon:yes stop_codon:yes gene_type:complete
MTYKKLETIHHQLQLIIDEENKKGLQDSFLPTGELEKLEEIFDQFSEIVFYDPAPLGYYEGETDAIWQEIETE